MSIACWSSPKDLTKILKKPTLCWQAWVYSLYIYSGLKNLRRTFKKKQQRRIKSSVPPESERISSADEQNPSRMNPAACVCVLGLWIRLGGGGLPHRSCGSHTRSRTRQAKPEKEADPTSAGVRRRSLQASPLYLSFLSWKAPLLLPSWPFFFLNKKKAESPSFSTPCLRRAKPANRQQKRPDWGRLPPLWLNCGWVFT